MILTSENHILSEKVAWIRKGLHGDLASCQNTTLQIKLTQEKGRPNTSNVKLTAQTQWPSTWRLAAFPGLVDRLLVIQPFSKSEQPIRDDTSRNIVGKALEGTVAPTRIKTATPYARFRKWFTEQQPGV